MAACLSYFTFVRSVSLFRPPCSATRAVYFQIYRREMASLPGMTTQPRRGQKKVKIWNGILVSELMKSLNKDFGDVKFALERSIRKFEDRQTAFRPLFIRKDTPLGLRIATSAVHMCNCVPQFVKGPPDPSTEFRKRPPKTRRRRLPKRKLKMTRRPPVVSILGHVDHGKTTLLDSLRKSRIVDTEFGGITQHTGSFSVRLPATGDVITFLDTPGHAAFSAMRARGAQLTDIVILVVAAEDGVMPQTRESINHAYASKVPLVVAINKCDMPNADPQRAREQLASLGVIAEELGGSIQMVNISALKGEGLEELQEAIMVQAELLELEAPLQGRVEAAVIEARLEPRGRGVLATVLVQSGTLRPGHIFVADTALCRVQALFGDSGKRVKTATPGQAVDVMGFKQLPSAGDVLKHMPSLKSANSLIQQREKIAMQKKAEKDAEAWLQRERVWRQVKTAHKDHVLEVVEATKKKVTKVHRGKIYRLKRRMSIERDVVTGRAVTDEKEESKPKLSIIIRADVDGSLEAILTMLSSYSSAQCELDIVNFDVGPPTETDLELAASFDASIYCFNVEVPEHVKKVIMLKKMRLHELNIIYRLAEQLRAELQDQLPHLVEEEEIGVAEVIQLFVVTEDLGHRRVKVPVLGCRCVSGELRHSSETYYQLVRGDEVLFEGECESLRHLKSTVDVISRGKECGVRLRGMDVDFEVLPDDELICLRDVEVPQVLEWDNPF